MKIRRGRAFDAGNRGTDDVSVFVVEFRVLKEATRIICSTRFSRFLEKIDPRSRMLLSYTDEWYASCEVFLVTAVNSRTAKSNRGYPRRSVSSVLGRHEIPRSIFLKWRNSFRSVRPRSFLVGKLFFGRNSELRAPGITKVSSQLIDYASSRAVA